MKFAGGPRRSRRPCTSSWPAGAVLPKPTKVQATAQLHLARIRADRGEDLQVEDCEHALEQQRQIRPVIAALGEVRRLPPHLAAVDSPQRVVQRVQDEEVPRLVPRLAIILL
eukprot:scaffold36068_cov70-Phaeocystis_antarctica.AAC.2